jgi:hypothetical protein
MMNTGICEKKTPRSETRRRGFRVASKFRQRPLSIEANGQGHGKSWLDYCAAEVAAAVIHRVWTDDRGDTDRCGTIIRSELADLMTDRTMMIVFVRFGAINIFARTVLHPVDAVRFSAADETVLPGMLPDNLNPTLILAKFPEFITVDGAGYHPVADPFLLPRLTLTDGPGGECRSAQQKQDAEHDTWDRNSFFHDMPP